MELDFIYSEERDYIDALLRRNLPTYPKPVMAFHVTPEVPEIATEYIIVCLRTGLPAPAADYPQRAADIAQHYTVAEALGCLIPRIIEDGDRTFILLVRPELATSLQPPSEQRNNEVGLVLATISCLFNYHRHHADIYSIALTYHLFNNPDGMPEFEVSPHMPDRILESLGLMPESPQLCPADIRANLRRLPSSLSLLASVSAEIAEMLDALGNELVGRYPTQMQAWAPWFRLFNSPDPQNGEVHVLDRTWAEHLPDEAFKPLVEIAGTATSSLQDLVETSPLFDDREKLERIYDALRLAYVGAPPLPRP